MPENAVKLFVKQKERYRGQDYLSYTIIYHLAPVLETHRPAVILSLVDDRRRLFTLWEENKHAFFPVGKINFCELKRTEKSVSVLFYHFDLLDKTINRDSYRAFLQKYGYDKQMTLMAALGRLHNRFQHQGCPHEVGVFLGIPLEDIRGFMNNDGKGYCAYGSWKVYADLQHAFTIFGRFEEAKMRFINYIKRGYPPGDYLRIHASRKPEYKIH